MALIKVFSGSQVGATSSLVNNLEYRIGNHYECDIYIEDSSNVEYTCEFNLNNNCIIFSTIDEANLLLNSGENVQTNVEYPFPFYFIIGAVKLAIGVNINEWQEYTPEIEESNFLEDESVKLDFIHSVESVENIPDNMIVTKNKLDNRIMQMFSLFTGGIVKFHSKHKFKFYIGMIIFVIVALMITSLVTTMNKYQQQNQKITLIEQQDRNLKKKFTELPAKYSNLALKKVNNGYQISGLIVDAEDEVDIKKYFQIFASMLTYKFINVVTAEDKIQIILANYNVESLDVAYNTSSQQLIVSGITDVDMNKINEMEIEINNKIPEVPNISFLIFSKQQVINDITSVMGDMSKFLTIKESDTENHIDINGYLTQNQLTALSESLDTVRTKYQNIITLKLNVKNALSALPFKIYSVYNGEQPYIVTNTGKIVYVGGQIGGFTLSSITDDKIVFKGSKFKLDIPLSQVGGDPINSANSSTGGKTSRNGILQDEQTKIKKLLVDEEQQLLMIRTHKAKTTDAQLQKFFQQQENILQEDIKLKQQDLNLLNEGA